MEKEDKTISYVDSYDIIRDWFQGEDKIVDKELASLGWGWIKFKFKRCPQDCTDS